MSESIYDQLMKATGSLEEGQGWSKQAEGELRDLLGELKELGHPAIPQVETALQFFPTLYVCSKVITDVMQPFIEQSKAFVREEALREPGE